MLGEMQCQALHLSLWQQRNGAELCSLESVATAGGSNLVWVHLVSVLVNGCLEYLHTYGEEKSRQMHTKSFTQSLRGRVPMLY